MFKNFLWGKVGKYQIFFVPLQPKTKFNHNFMPLIRISNKQK